jgi:hypothetical protein
VEKLLVLRITVLDSLTLLIRLSLLILLHLLQVPKKSTNPSNGNTRTEPAGESNSSAPGTAQGGIDSNPQSVQNAAVSLGLAMTPLAPLAPLINIALAALNVLRLLLELLLLHLLLLLPLLVLADGLLVLVQLDC